MCTVENFGSPCDSSTYIWHRVFCEKLPVTLWFVHRHLTLCVLWKIYCTVYTVQNLLHCVYCKTLTAQCVLWKTYCTVFTMENLLHCVYCRKLTALCVLKNNWLTSYISKTWFWHYVYLGKLTDIIHFGNMILTLCVPWKTDWHHTLRKHDIDIMCSVENLLTSSCTM